METTFAPTATVSPRPPLSRRYVWIALIVATALPVVIFGTVIALLASANYNFLDWME